MSLAVKIAFKHKGEAYHCVILIYTTFIVCIARLNVSMSISVMGAAASSLGSAVSCRVEGRAIDTALGQCFIPNSSH